MDNPFILLCYIGSVVEQFQYHRTPLVPGVCTMKTQKLYCMTVYGYILPDVIARLRNKKNRSPCQIYFIRYEIVGNLMEQ